MKRHNKRPPTRSDSQSDDDDSDGDSNIGNRAKGRRRCVPKPQSRWWYIVSETDTDNASSSSSDDELPVEAVSSSSSKQSVRHAFARPQSQQPVSQARLQIMRKNLQKVPGFQTPNPAVAPAPAPRVESLLIYPTKVVPEIGLVRYASTKVRPGTRFFHPCILSRADQNKTWELLDKTAIKRFFDNNGRTRDNVIAKALRQKRSDRGTQIVIVFRSKQDSQSFLHQPYERAMPISCLENRCLTQPQTL